MKSEHVLEFGNLINSFAVSTVVPSRNRYGRPYISGRPLLTCDRQKIVECYKKGMKKIHIAKQLGITHSCVSKVLRRQVLNLKVSEWLMTPTPVFC